METTSAAHGLLPHLRGRGRRALPRLPQADHARGRTGCDRARPGGKEAGADGRVHRADRRPGDAHRPRRRRGLVHDDGHERRGARLQQRPARKRRDAAPLPGRDQRLRGDGEEEPRPLDPRHRRGRSLERLPRARGGDGRTLRAAQGPQRGALHEPDGDLVLRGPGALRPRAAARRARGLRGALRARALPRRVHRRGDGRRAPRPRRRLLPRPADRHGHQGPARQAPAHGARRDARRDAPREAEPQGGEAAGRVSYPIDHIKNIVRPISSAPAAKNVIFLSADAFGVLPPVSILTPEQTQYYFLSGFTAKLAGTERGITEPTPTFSACFGQAFLELHPTKYAEELVKKMQKSGAKAYLVNTGWNGSGKRISIKDTRGIIDAILNGDINNVSTKKIPYFDFEVPTELNGVDTGILDPRDTYTDASEWETKAKDLAARFIKNFSKYEGNAAGKALVSAGPQL